jgi:hypothetical protein
MRGAAVSSPSISKLPPRYSLLLNSHIHERLSKCPICHKPTHPRKFALFIHIDDWGPLALGKTCRYCTPCELIIVHKHELDAELAHSLATLAPRSVGKGYLVLGTLDKKVWRAGLEGPGAGLAAALEHVALFRKRMELHVEPGGWRRSEG